MRQVGRAAEQVGQAASMRVERHLARPCASRPSALDAELSLCARAAPKVAATRRKIAARTPRDASSSSATPRDAAPRRMPRCARRARRRRARLGACRRGRRRAACGQPSARAAPAISSAPSGRAVRALGALPWSARRSRCRPAGDERRMSALARLGDRGRDRLGIVAVDAAATASPRPRSASTGRRRSTSEVAPSMEMRLSSKSTIRRPSRDGRRGRSPPG